ncbi:hypothetical protein RQP46_001611 [Phenoliferia psychrophenolica]
MSTSRLAPLSAYSKLIVLAATAGPHVRNALAAPVIAVSKHERTPPGSDEFFTKLAFSAFLVIIGGVFSGLTLGLMGLDMTNLQVLATSGSEKERKDAAKVTKLLDKGRHWVLVCLLLSNVIVNESLPIFLDSVLGGGLGAVVLSTTLIVIFGEIIPQAVCARYGLSIGATCTPFVLTLMYLEYPVAYPIAKLLDYLLGESHGTVYKKAELKTLVGIHGHVGEEMLNEDEVTIISAVLELGGKSVSEIMTPIEDTYTLSSDAVLDRERVDEILALGHSRIPIHVPGHNDEFVGMLIVKKLITYDPSTAQTVGSFPLSVLPETGPDSTCLDALNYNPGVDGNAIGVVTLEDVIEEIVDETDIYVDVQQKIKVVRGPSKRAAGKALAPLIQGVIERRKGHRQASGADYGTLEYGAAKDGAQVPTPPTPKAFSKVKLRGGGEPERRSDLVDRIETRMSRAPSFDPEQQPLSTSPTGGADLNGETRPLLGSKSKKP